MPRWWPFANWFEKEKNSSNGGRWSRKKTARSGSRLDPQVVDPLSRPEVRGQPARLLSSTRPGLRGLVRIPEFREDSRIGPAASFLSKLLRQDSPIELPQAIFDHALFGNQLRGERGNDFLPERP
jgi:hypothetical protein